MDIKGQGFVNKKANNQNTKDDKDIDDIKEAQGAITSQMSETKAGPPQPKLTPKSKLSAKKLWRDNKNKIWIKILAIILAGVVVLGIVLIVLAIIESASLSKHSVEVEGATVSETYMKDGVAHIDAKLDVDCGVMVTEHWLECQDYNVQGTFDSDGNVYLSTPNNTPNGRTEGNEFFFTAEKVAVLPSEGPREEPITGPVVTEYTITLHDKNNDNAVLIYTLTINTNFSENDLMFINPS